MDVFLQEDQKVKHRESLKKFSSILKRVKQEQQPLTVDQDRKESKVRQAEF